MMQIARKLKLSQAGDTIVEVMISLAILTLIIGGAFYSANQSITNDSSSQEHSQALTMAQSQIEAIWAYSSTNSSVFLTGNTASDTCLEISKNLSAQTSTYCSFDNSGNPNCITSTSSFCYTVADSLLPAPNSDTNCLSNVSIICYNYQVVVKWPALGGGNNQATLYYRVDKNG